MAYNSDILLGRITKASGYEGAVTVKLEKIFSENIPQMESVFLEIEGRLVPFFISDSEYSGADIIRLSFEGYNTIEKVNGFIGSRVFLTSDIKDDDTTDDIRLLTGYKVLVQDDKLLGSVKEIIPNPGQWLLAVTSTKNKEILIPLHEHFIVRINKRKKTILLDIPEGLTEIN
ncbi:MAG TPA: ribosome maturation factor RimM [Bacteroidales bacterium]|nr:ribosome maturation factor RimM [Bacteroidales bacterium]